MPQSVTRRAVLGACVTVGVSVAGCLDGDGGDGDGENGGGDDPLAGDAEGEEDLRLTSAAFDDGGSIPRRYTRDGENVNPPLAIEGVPDESESLALVVDDPDAPGGTFDHWLVWNVPPDVGSIPEDWSPSGSVRQGENGFGNTGYDGPEPPGGETHEYRFKLYALDAELAVQAGANKDRLGEAAAGRILARTQVTGTYGS